MLYYYDLKYLSIISIQINSIQTEGEKYNLILEVLINTFKGTLNRIGGVMVSVLASSAVDRGFEPGRVKPKTIKLVFVASPLSTQQKLVGSESG